MTRIAFCIGILHVFIARPLCADETLIVTMHCASTRLARNDCQIVRVSVLNTSAKEVTLDSLFPLVFHGPQFEITFPDGTVRRVMAIGQGFGAAGTRDKSVIKPGEEKRLFAVLLSWRSEQGRGLIFESKGAYGIRAGVAFKEKTFWSDSERCNVSDDAIIEWKDREQELRSLIARWESPIHGIKATTNLPPGSLMLSLAELSNASKRVLNGQDEERSEWAKLKSTQGKLLADFASEGMASNLRRRKQFREALIELEGMELQTEESIGLSTELQHQIKGQRVIGPLQ